jgi:shikimate kinase
MIRAGDEAAFRAAESDVMKSAFARPGAVVATGGGAALHADLLRGVAAIWPIVFLDPPSEVLLARWDAAPRAPLSDLPPAKELARQRRERCALYAELAALTIDTSRESPDETAESVADLVDWDWERSRPTASGPVL